jgi:uncharacterized protein (TIGR03435 family)
MNFMKLQTMRVNVCAGLALLMAGAVFGQTPATPPAFEVASVKPAPPPANPGELKVQIGGDPGMIDYKNVSLKMVIARAYELKEFQISGPDWLDTTRFDILAKVPPNAPKGQTPLMLQNLLAERFKLKVHREQKVMPMYALVVAKSGFKLKPLEGEPEGRMSMTIAPKGRQMSGPTTLAALSGGLSRMMDRPVVDLTGIQGTYQVDLEWVPDESEGGGMMAKMHGMAAQAGGVGEAHGEAADPNGLSLFGALQEKLGLKLEARKSPVDILVVDGAEKIPTEN